MFALPEVARWPTGHLVRHVAYASVLAESCRMYALVATVDCANLAFCGGSAGNGAMALRVERRSSTSTLSMPSWSLSVVRMRKLRRGCVGYAI